MTHGFSKGPLWSTPERIAEGIVRAAGRRGRVVYLPGFWRYIMCLIKLLPGRLFDRLSL